MRQESGFTLLEVLIAVILMSVIFLSFATMPNIYKQIRNVYETKTLIQDYLESTMEKQRRNANINYNSFSSSCWTSQEDVAGRKLRYCTTVTGKTINDDYTLSNYTGKSTPPIKEVKVEVESIYKGATQNISDSFLVSSP